MSKLPRYSTHVLVAVLALLAGGCKREAKQDTKGQPIAVQVTTVAPGSIARTLVYDADIMGELEVKVFAQVAEEFLERWRKFDPSCAGAPAVCPTCQTECMAKKVTP